MRVFGMDIPAEKIPDGAFKQFMACDDGDYLWTLSAPDYTQEERNWIQKTLKSRERQLLAGTPLKDLKYEG